MLGVCLPYLFYCLGSVGEGVHGRGEERLDICHVRVDRATQGVQEGVKQVLDVVIYDRLDRLTADRDTVHLDLTGKKDN